jgi:glycosyltransferase involved in cell wall biosynthesis
MSRPTCGFSVVVPTIAPPPVLDGCLGALSLLRAPSSGFEVIIVDDGSPEPLDALVAPYRSRVDLTLIRQPNRGPGQARNAGAQIARGSFLAFTDADCRPEASWLNAFEQGFARTSAHMLGGRTINLLMRNPYSTASQLIVDIVYAFYNCDPDGARFFASNNIAVAGAGSADVV